MASYFKSVQFSSHTSLTLCKATAATSSTSPLHYSISCRAIANTITATPIEFWHFVRLCDYNKHVWGDVFKVCISYFELVQHHLNHLAQIK